MNLLSIVISCSFLINAYVGEKNLRGPSTPKRATIIRIENKLEDYCRNNINHGRSVVVVIQNNYQQPKANPRPNKARQQSRHRSYYQHRRVIPRPKTRNQVLAELEK